MKADSQTKSIQLEFLFKLLKIKKKFYLDYAIYKKIGFELGFLFLFSLFRLGKIYLS